MGLFVRKKKKPVYAYEYQRTGPRNPQDDTCIKFKRFHTDREATEIKDLIKKERGTKQGCPLKFKKTGRKRPKRFFER